jgi:hypothetical protein
MDEGLTLHRLAATTGLAPDRISDLCQRFVDYLPATGSGHARRWAQDRVAILRTIHELDQAGYSPEQIRRQLAAAAQTDPAAPDGSRTAWATKPSVAGAAVGSGLGTAMVEPGYPVTLEEGLRTIGTGLDRLRVVRFAQFTIDGRGILVDATSPVVHTLHTWSALALEAECQRQARRPGPRAMPDADLLALTRWTVLLRLVGVLMDADRLRTATLEVQVARPETPTVCEARLHTNRGVADLAEDIRLLLLRRRAQFSPREEPRDALEPRSPRRRWWSWS